VRAELIGGIVYMSSPRNCATDTTIQKLAQLTGDLWTKRPASRYA